MDTERFKTVCVSQATYRKLVEMKVRLETRPRRRRFVSINRTIDFLLAAHFPQGHTAGKSKDEG